MKCKKHNIEKTQLILTNVMSGEDRIDIFCVKCKQEKRKTERDKAIMKKFYITR